MDHQTYSEALLFAEQAHRGQSRKGSEVPYITHPVGVSAILAQYGYDQEIVLAGLLHDTVEDTGTSIGEIERRFGRRVAELVAGVSEEKKRDGEEVPWEERKREAARHLQEAPVEVVALKAADALHNVRSIIRDRQVTGEAVWDRFNRGKAQQLANYRLLADVIRDRLGPTPLAAELAEAVAEMEKESRGVS